MCSSDLLGVTTEYTMDDLGRIEELTEAKDTAIERTIEFEYGNFDLRSKIWGRFNSQTLEATFSYNLFGNMTAQTDANGNGTSYSYDYLNRRTSKTNAEGHTEDYSYDTVGNWTGLTDPNGNFTGFAYTGNNELQTTTYPNFTAETNIYDAAGNRTGRVTRAGETIAFEYDDFNRLVKKIFPDSSETTYDYDQLGRMTDAANDDSTYEFIFNNLNQLTGVTFTDYTGNEYTTSYEYDLVGNKTKITYPESYYYYTRTYDALNRLDLVKDRDNSTIADYTYDDLNRRTRRDYLNGTWATYTYNDIGWLTDLVNWRTETDTISSFAYTHDNVGNRLTMTTSFGTQTYSYDKIYEVTGADCPAFFAFSDMTYEYDSCWNRESTVNGGTTNYLTNNLNQYTSVEGTSYTYDDNGNNTDDSIQTYYYDFENRLTAVVRNFDGQTLGEYRYDPFGRRVKKIIDNGSTVINYLYDVAQVIEERDGNWNLLRRYDYGPRIDEPISMYDSSISTFYFYQRDGLGSVTEITDEQGDTIEHYRYSPYGKLKIYNSSWSELTASSAGDPYFFTGRRFDEESGLYYYRARMYSAKVGRFLQVDPVGFRDGFNLYVFVHNNAINWVDPWGLEKIMIVYVDQPGSGGDRDTYERAPDGEIDVGHTFVSVQDTDTGTIVTLGFYPVGSVNPFYNRQVSGVVQSDRGHCYEVKKEFILTDAQYTAAKNQMRNALLNPPTYNLNTFNCTDWVEAVARTAGQNIPDTHGFWPGGEGSNPGDLGEELR